MTNQPVRLVAFANGTHAKGAMLAQAVPNARELATLLEKEHQYETCVFPDVDPNSLQLAVKEKLGKGALAGGTLILSWTGHGVVGIDGTLRLLGTFDDEDIELASAARLGEWAAQTGALQVLVVLDTCSSGAGVIDAAQLARSVIEQKASRSSAWLGVIAASLTDEPALSGALSRELQRLLRNGPKDPNLRWDRKREYIRGDDLLQALRDDWSEPRQTPQILATSSRAWDLVRNPLFEPGLPDQVVEHLLQAARGYSGEENFFTGRDSALRRIVSWMSGRKPGLFVVTGPPGSGKSAVLGRIVSLSSKEERQRILRLGSVPAELDPQEGSVDAHIQARGVTIDIAAEELLRRLGLDPADGRFGLLSAAERRRKAGDPLVLAVDGLDEAGAIGREMAAEFLKPLAHECLLLVATRDVLSYGQESLIATLGPAAERLDLAEDGSTQADIHEYVVRRLRAVDPAMDPALVADEIVASGGAAASFLLARLVTSQLSEKPVNTSMEGWQLTLSATVESALERDLQSAVLQVGGRPHPTAAREMLRALTLAYGSGFPADDVWPVVATAISETGTAFTRDDAYQTLALLGRHLVAGSESGQPVYRLAHQRLVEYLSADGLVGADPEVHRRQRSATAVAISDLYNEFLDSGYLPNKHQYLWRYGWRHLAEGGAEGLKRLHQLAERDPVSFLPDLASGLQLAASSALLAGSVDEAAEQLEQAINLWRTLQQTSRLSMALFQLAMIRLAKGDQEGADAAATEASAVVEQLPESSDRRKMSALTLLGRAFTEIAEGRYQGAKLLAEKASLLSGEQEAGSDGWELRALAGLVAGKAAAGLRDQSASVALCQQSVDLTVRYGDPEADPTFTDALATLTCGQLALAAAYEPADGKDPWPPASCAAGAWLVEDGPRWGRNSLRKLDVNRGLCAMVRARLLDDARGVDVSHLGVPGVDSLPGLLDQIVDDVAPFSATLSDAAFTCATALELRASLRPESAKQLAELDRSQAISILRPFSHSNPAIAGTLGAFVFESVSRDVQEINKHLEDIDQLSARLQEAISLLRRSGLLFAADLARAITTLPTIWQAAGRADLQKASTGDAVAELRGLVGTTPRAPIYLAVMLSDLAALNLDTPLVAEQLAGEAFALAKSLPSSPDVDFALAVSEINFASIRGQLRKQDDVSDLLKDAIRRFEAMESHPLNARMLGTAYTGLALAQNRAGNFAQALELAQCALGYFEQPTDFPFIGAESLASARLVEGWALQHLGQTQQGDAIVNEIIGNALENYTAGKEGPSRLASILNESGSDTWEAALAHLRDSPHLLGMLRIHRFRPVDEIDLTVATLVEELASGDPSNAIEVRAMARSHRLINSELFDVAWQKATGELPLWLQLDLTVIGSAILWFTCDSLLSARNYLEDHPSLLHSTTDAILEEFRFTGAPGESIDQAEEIISRARVTSVREAYAPLLAADSVDRWLNSEDKIEYLNENPELLTFDVASYVSKMAGQDEEAYGPLAAILELAKRDELGIVMEIEKDPCAGFKFLEPAWRSKDVSRLAALAGLIRGFSKDDSYTRRSTTALAVARVLQNREADAKRLMLEATKEAGADDVRGMIEILGDALAHHQSFAPSFAALIQMMPNQMSNADLGG
jgi:tetratricopeptide (TPR) repeat protein